MSKITRLQVDGFKRIVILDIRPGAGAGVVPIRGRNAQGKSSTLDAIAAALGGRACMPGRPVRNGEDEGAIRIELDDGAVILRRFTVDGKGDSIEVTNAEGFKAPSPQKMLSSLYASVAFDPLAFTRMEPKKQREMLQGLVKLDVDVPAIEKQIAADYEARADKNRELKAETTRLGQMPAIDISPDAEKVDETALEAAINQAAETNGQIERRRLSRETFAAALEGNRTTLAELQHEMANLQIRIEEYEKVIAGQEKQLAEAQPLPDPVDVTQAQADLRAAMQTNRQIEQAQVRRAQALLVQSLTTASEALTTAMDERRTAIADAIARANMPVPGLGFGDGEVLFNGLPLDQASSAEQLRISTAIGMASSPKLRVMLVRDGSLLDDEGEKILADMAAEHDFQLWVEAVDTSGKVGIVFEAGEVVSIDGEPAPEPEAIEKAKRRKPKPADDADDGARKQAEADGSRARSPLPGDMAQTAHEEPQEENAPQLVEGRDGLGRITADEPAPPARPTPTSLFD